jgi:ABC-2 type transport system ATP-binding protein
MEIRSLTKQYGKQVVLSDINIRMDRGHVYGIMGENGAGKTTLLKCIVGLEKYSGTITIDCPSLGYLPDQPYYYSLTTGMEMIEFCLKAKGLHINHQEINRLNDVFQLPLRNYPSQYSLGMQKRLMILILMLENNDLYVLDEPFNGLDLEGGIILKQWLKKQKELGKLIIVTSHIIPSLADTCDKIFYLHKGRLAETFQNMSTDEIENVLTEKYLNLTNSSNSR